MKNYALITILILSSCSLPQSKMRKYSSFTLDNCFNMVSGIIQRPSSRTGQREPITNFEGLQEQFNTSEALTLDVLDSLKEANQYFSPEYADEIFNELKHYSNTALNEIPLNEIYEKAIINYASKGRNDFLYFDEVYLNFKHNFPRPEHLELFLNNYHLFGKEKLPPFVIRDILNGRDETPGKTVSHFIKVKILKSRIHMANDINRVLSLIKKAHKFDIARDDLAFLVSETPFMKGIKNAPLKKAITDSLENNTQINSRQLATDIRNAINIANNEDNIVMDQVTTSYTFSLALEKVLKGKVSNSIDELYGSTYFVSTSLPLERVKKVVTRIKTKDNINKQLIANEFFKEFGDHHFVKSLKKISRYNNEVSIIGIKNQASWGSCWCHTAIETLEAKISKTVGHEVELSPDYSYAQYLINQYKSIFMNINGTNLNSQLVEGGNYGKFVTLMNYYGVVPVSSWKPKATLFSNSTRRNIQIQISDLYNRMKREFDGKDRLEKIEIAKNYLVRIDQLFNRYLGELPTQFQFNGRTYSPTEFLDAHNTHIDKNVYFLTQRRSLNRKSVQQQMKFYQGNRLRHTHSGLTRYIYKDLTEVEKVIIDSIDQGRPLAASFDWVNTGKEGNKTHTFINKVTGNIRYMDNATYPPQGGGHAVMIAGYELDFSGRIKSLKILNSWGEGSGDTGFYHMDISYFKEFNKHLAVQNSDGLGQHVPKNSSLRSLASKPD